MPQNHAQTEEVLDILIQGIWQKIPKNKAPLAEQFAREFAKAVAWQELKTRPLVDLYGLVISNWQQFLQRTPQEFKITLYNPNYEQQGWQSTHTVACITTPDIPFLVDSVRMVFNRHGITTHLILQCPIPVTRDATGKLEAIGENSLAKRETCLYLELDKQTNVSILEELKTNLMAVLKDVSLAVIDWQPMLGKAHELLDELHIEDKEELAEIKDFIHWLIAGNFTFLGHQDYSPSHHSFKAGPKTGFGILREEHPHAAHEGLKQLVQLTHPEGRRTGVLTLAKSDFRSTIHRPAYMDLIAIKRVNHEGHVIGIRCFLGLYTSTAYNARPQDIPILRRKINQIFARSRLAPTSHSGKELLNILENYPRDEVFQASVEDLFHISTNILQMQERKQIRLFVRRDIFDRFVSCLVFVPRERYETTLRQKVQAILKQELEGERVEYSTTFSESVLARTHYIVHLVPPRPINVDVAALEKKLAEAGCNWEDNLKIALIENFGEAKGNILFNRYNGAFPIHYQNNYLPQIAVADIERIEELNATNNLGMRLYRPLEAEEGLLSLKLFRSSTHSIYLSDVVPILENMGLQILSEHPYKVALPEQTIWLQNFSMRNNQSSSIQDLEHIKQIFQEAFANIWFGHAENDGFNCLVLAIGATWREIALIRAYAKYLQQTGFTFSQSYIEQTLEKNSTIVKLLIQLFHTTFSPELRGKDNPLSKQIQHALESVESLNEDRILRRFLALIQASLRTNFYQTTREGHSKSYISFKLNPLLIPDLPLPRPVYEIFVYSPIMEGVHLRGGKVARGGIRWSDRREDFRTEVLGLMKAQQVKNAVIVPVGAKGGFVIKHLEPSASREVRAQTGIDCYSTLIRGLLDITDNLKFGKVIPPERTIRLDEDDPYLVVAADKGTATFSDIANAIAKEYDFWLGDAFASGGSNGYDHKKMSITARGVWESVRRHFREMNINPDQQDITVIGIGDMAGDVFGNGMLLSRHIKLLGAFNHQHIFLDPNPNSEKSFEERSRLFSLPRSTWEDYNPALISKGGGIFRRGAKSILLSPEIQQLLDLKAETIEPNELIKAMLRAKTDLLYNGGIGTYVKATTESNDDVGDRSNDALRINGQDLHCKVVVEGGNLGFTQLGRVEYALHGGRIYTDFIDNCGGVHCSDNEVNIKVLLNEVVSNGDLTEKQRQKLLAEMTEEVSEIVIRSNYRQTQALSIAEYRAPARFEDHIRLIHHLEKSGKLDRILEGLPTDEQLASRKLNKQTLTTPEIAVLLAYTKNILKHELVTSPLLEDPYFLTILEKAFPSQLVKKFPKALKNHRLRQEIIATQIANNMNNEMGATFVQRLKDETGASSAAIASCLAVAHSVFDMEGCFNEIQSLDNKVPANTQIAMMLEIMRLVRRGTRWFLKNFRKGLNIQATIQDFAPQAKTLRENLTQALAERDLQLLQERSKEYIKAGVPVDLAERISALRTMFSALDIIQAAKNTNQSVADMATLHFEMGDKLKIEWLREQASAYIPEDHWEGLALAAFRDDLDYLQSQLTSEISRAYAHIKPFKARIEAWIGEHGEYVGQWNKVVGELSTATTTTPEFALFPVAIKELSDLVQLSKQV